MSLWIDSEDTQEVQSSDQMIDVVFKIKCKALPVDHADELSAAILRLVPWLKDLDRAGVQSIHVAGSQNGWERPDPRSGEVLYLSRRTRLRIRVDLPFADQLISDLSDKEFSIGGFNLQILVAEKRLLTATPTVFSRYVLFDTAKTDKETEIEFERHVVRSCEHIGFSPTKILCGRLQIISSQSAEIVSRSVMIGDLEPLSSLKLQEEGLGINRYMGCGIVLPHKDTSAV